MLSCLHNIFTVILSLLVLCTAISAPRPPGDIAITITIVRGYLCVNGDQANLLKSMLSILEREVLECPRDKRSNQEGKNDAKPFYIGGPGSVRHNPYDTLRGRIQHPIRHYGETGQRSL